MRGAVAAAAVILGVLGLGSPGPEAAQAGTVSIQCSRDNTLFQDAEGDTSNGSGPAFFAGNNGQNLIRRGLVRFELLGVVPAGAAIEDAVLTLEVSSAPDTVPRWIALHRVLADWGEGSSTSSGGGGAPAQPGDATWLHTRYPDHLWSVPGGDFVAASSAAALVADVDTYRWTGAGLRADIQRWLSDPTSNFGWLLRGDESVARSVRRFDSRESAVPSSRPVLTIVYSEPVPSRPTTWARLKTRFRRGEP
jgi:hypothetical protein